eukprot:TRINITY_DN6813_c0_g1_i1.p1 TRINITY_DN6813_c0_g1~~TRINITY_DN6813_c0_g1_i1.p1  ORF type:complete len:469 (-),score=76.85 TRINITY_DN6813_c0_g1_i1:70-1476(-)
MIKPQLRSYTHLAHVQSLPSLERKDSSNVFSQTWTRQLNKEGRVYYFNRATGASQWHIPNELYTSQYGMMKRKQMTAAMEDLKGVGLAGIRVLRSNSEAALLMPGHARACRKVDCVTEGFIPKQDSAPSTHRSGKSQNGYATEKLIERSAIRICVKSASGLRDADGDGDLRNLSDPYCVCELQGTAVLESSQFRTHVISDCLDPVWDFEGTLEAPFYGHTLEFSVFDDDPTDITAMIESVGNDMNDFLGVAELSVDEGLRREGPIELQLKKCGVDRNGKPLKSMLTVEVSGPCTAFPSLVGMDIQQAVQSLKEQRPDLMVRVFELASEDVTFSVASSDPLLSRNGYSKRFFGAIDVDAARFRKGDKVQFYPHQFLVKGQLVGDKKKAKIYTVDKVVPSGGQCKGKNVVYVHIQEEKFAMVVQDGMQWRRLPVNPETGRVGPLPGFRPERVCLHFDPETNKVGPLPRTG